MDVYFHSKFKKQFKKLPISIQDQFEERLDLWKQDHNNPLLRVHQLKGKYIGYWSLNINADIRALYKFEGKKIVMFVMIGTHSELYG